MEPLAMKCQCFKLVTAGFEDMAKGGAQLASQIPPTAGSARN